MLRPLDEPILRRVPPGDNWTPSGGDLAHLFSSLTEALSWVFKEFDHKEFYVSASQGEVYVMAEFEENKEEDKKEEKIEKEIEDLYGDK